MAQFKILSTKKLSPPVKEQAERKGIEITEQEFIQTQPILTKEKHEEILHWVKRPEATAVVFTSGQAVQSYSRHVSSRDTYYIPNWRIFCLSGATRAALEEINYTDKIIDTADNAAELAKVIIKIGRFKQVIFFCGNKRRDDLPTLLKENGIEVIEVIVYETTETPVVTTGELDAVLFFSPSAVKSFFSVNSLSKKTTCFAIGPTTAAAITNFTDNRLITIETPSQEEMMASVWFYFQNINQYE